MYMALSDPTSSAHWCHYQPPAELSMTFWPANRRRRGGGGWCALLCSLQIQHYSRFYSSLLNDKWKYSCALPCLEISHHLPLLVIIFMFQKSVNIVKQVKISLFDPRFLTTSLRLQFRFLSVVMFLPITRESLNWHEPPAIHVHAFKAEFIFTPD